MTVGRYPDGDPIPAVMPEPAFVPGGLAFPPRVAVSESGWLDDSDRDSAQAARLQELYRDMDRLVSSYLGGDKSDTVTCDRMCMTWQKIRTITKEA